MVIKESFSYLIEDVLQLILRQSRALDIFHSTQFLGHPITVFLANGLHLLLCQLLSDSGVISQIGLSADNQAWHTGTVVVNLGEPLFSHVLKRRR